MRTVVVGNRKLARHVLRSLLENGWDVVGALSPDEERASAQANYESLEDVVAGTRCDLHRTNDINDEPTVEWLRDRSPDVCISGGWSQIIDEDVLEIPREAFLGFHASRLPEGRGGAPVNWNIIRGAREQWISLFHYVPGVDAGDVVAQDCVPVEQRDDVATVFDALASKACQMLDAVREDLESRDPDAEPQSLAEATYRPRRQPQDGLIDWNRDPVSQYDWVRAQTDPYPGAYTFVDDTKLSVLSAELHDGSIPTDAKPGEVLEVVSGEGFDVRSGDGVFRVTRVRADDGPSRWADRYARDVGLTPGDRLNRESAPESWYYTGIRGPEDAMSFETNLDAGSVGRVELLAHSGSDLYLDEKVWLDDELIFEGSVTVEPTSRNRVEYAPDHPGTHTLSIAFENDGKRLDTRYLKVFVH